MIQKIDMSAQKFDLDEDIKKYIVKKIGRLDKYITPHSRKSVHAEVKLIKESAKGAQKYTAEAIIHIPHEQVTARDSTVNVYAAIDIVEAKLRNQLKKAKDKNRTYHTTRRSRVVSRILKLARRD